MITLDDSLQVLILISGVLNRHLAFGYDSQGDFAFQHHQRYVSAAFPPQLFLLIDALSMMVSLYTYVL